MVLLCLAVVTVLLVEVAGQKKRTMVADHHHQQQQRRASTVIGHHKTRMIGGTTPVVAPLNVYPAVAISAGPMLCGATVIHPDILLSAAHCQGVFLESGILIGTATQLSGSDAHEFRNVTMEMPHPDYRPGWKRNDIMLIKLETPTSAPLILYNTNPSITDLSNNLDIVGFGTSINGQAPSTLRHVQVQLVSNDECSAALEVHGYVADGSKMLCSRTR
jgi:secreted trypsin-like serine protease